jgi:hypothetical protein
VAWGHYRHSGRGAPGHTLRGGWASARGAQLQQALQLLTVDEVKKRIQYLLLV